MNLYRIKITMPDGSVGRLHGLFRDGFEAILRILDDFPGALSVSAICISQRGVA